MVHYESFLLIFVIPLNLQLQLHLHMHYSNTYEQTCSNRYAEDATPLQKEEIRKLIVSRRASDHEEGEIASAYDEDAIIDTEGSYV